MRKLLIVGLTLALPFLSPAQEDTTQAKNKRKVDITGLPVVAYDADMGFQYGLVGNLFYYGDRSTYPEYLHAVKIEISRFTKGSGVNQIFYDSKYLIPGGVRLTADLSYLTEKALDFFGYNGYQARYLPGLVDEDDPDYLTRMFYRHERRMFRLTADLQGPITDQRFRWLAGVWIMNFKTGRMDVERYNKGKKEEKQIPDTTTLFDLYADDWQIIPAEEQNGGNINLIRAGLVYDSRDNEPFPTKGLWDEAILAYSPEFFFNEQSFLKLTLIHRQYFNLLKERLVLTYRLGYQGTIAGHSPYYFQPYMLNSFSFATKTDGLGGAKNLRGILRNRVVGDGIAWGNLELRSKLVHFRVATEQFYIGLNVFGDAGLVVQEIDIDPDLIPEADRESYFDLSYNNDKIHPTVGAGLRIGWNDNFIIAVDYGFAMNAQDGKSGLYIAFGNLF